MSPENSVFTPEEREVLDQSFFVRHRLEEQYRDLEQQHETASLGMWVFLATEVLFFGALFVGLASYRYLYGPTFEKASEKLNWIVGGVNTVVLLVSSGAVVLAVHYARLGDRRRVVAYLTATAALGVGFLCLKGFEYFTDYRDYLIPGWRFRDSDWLGQGLGREEIPRVKLFLLFYWIMTGLHALHVTIGICVVSVMIVLAWKGHFSPAYYSPVDVTALYWHFVDIVWIFLLPMLYLQGTHTMADFHF